MPKPANTNPNKTAVVEPSPGSSVPTDGQKAAPVSTSGSARDTRSKEGPDPRSGAYSLDMKENTKFKQRKKLDQDERRQAMDQLRAHKEKKLQQYRKKKLLAGCEQVQNVSFDMLAMDDYPDNAQVAMARRERDYWLLLAILAGLVFFFGLINLASPWLAGLALGVLFVALALSLSPIRGVFIKRPTVGALLQKRKMIEFRALAHIRLLEGANGLAWRCSKLAKYNSNLENKLFNGLYRFSEDRSILDFMQEKKHIRLYLLLMVEAEKAYKRLQDDYLRNHFDNLEQGTNDELSDQEAAALEAELSQTNKLEDNG